ncbi:AI-2E family transporter [Flavobacterium sp. SUN052]|uniref:AI-2E family transporter n=1 Tax=Flavobacterium sp. SUN052 TaxID=3002441 RepID=UPI00237EAB40|nr:AI-2E family transporter [Flavobacterium sp. SUN052]MEC4005143.1 AI-2E family transporter [Flavobacterium sp. SUN052]
MITSKIIANGILRAIGVLTLIGVFLYFIYQIQTVLVYLIASIILCLIANPIVEFLKRKLKFSNTLAVITTLIFFFFTIIGIVLLFVPLVIAQGNNLSLLNTDLIQNKFIEIYNQFTIYLNEHHLPISKTFNTTDITSKFDFKILTNFFSSIIGLVSSIGITIGSMFFISFFLLKDKIKFVLLLKHIIPDNNESKILNSIYKTKELLSRYFTGLLIQMILVCLLYLIVLLVFGVQNAFVIAFLCALLNIIPYVGAFIGMILVSVLTLLSNINSDFQSVTLPTTIYVLIGFFIVHLIDSNVSQPIIFSRSVKSHPLEIFLIIVISGILFGITGMIVAVPFYTIVKVVAKEFLPENKIIKVLTKNI